MARRCGSVLPTIRKPDSCTWPRAKSARATSSATRPTKSARSSRAAAKTSFPRMTPGAPSKRSKLSRASCAGSSSCTRRHGPACFRQRAAWFSPALMKAISTRSMRARENRFGIFRPAARLLPIRFPSPSTVTIDRHRRRPRLLRFRSVIRLLPVARFHARRSRIPAAPMPPPMHMVTMP